MLIEKFLKQAKEEIIMDTVLSDEFMDKVQDNFAPIESLMATTGVRSWKWRQSSMF